MPLSARLFRIFLLVFQGRLSLRIVVLSTIVLFWIVSLMFIYMLLYRLYHRLRADYRQRRHEYYLPAVELVLLEEPYEKVLAALRPVRWGDAGVVHALLVENMRHLEGQPFETLTRVARDLGFIQASLRALRSSSKLRRGVALESLGIMRMKEAIPSILPMLVDAPIELRLAALRALAAIGDPSVLPAFLEASDTLSPPLMVRLASLMLEFGPPARPWVGRLIDRHSGVFDDPTKARILRELAALEDWA